MSTVEHLYDVGQDVFVVVTCREVNLPTQLQIHPGTIRKVIISVTGTATLIRYLVSTARNEQVGEYVGEDHTFATFALASDHIEQTLI